LGTESSLVLGSGSVWVASSLLATGTPASSYTGLLISGGTVQFSSPLPHSGLEIVVPLAVTCTLQLDFNPGVAADGSGAGQDARVSVVSLPAKATFVFSMAGALVSSVSTANATVYGSTVEIDVSAGPGTFNAVTSQIFYAATTPTTTFAIKDVSNTDLALHWIVALRMTIDRDWSWSGLASTGIPIQRNGVQVGQVVPQFTADNDALISPDRTSTDLVFFDVVEPKPAAGQFPAEINLTYTITPNFVGVPKTVDPPLTVSVELPITTPPAQVPKLVSAGIALSDYVRSADYSTTDPRQRVLWLEFDRAPDNPRDSFFGRILAYAPDPMLTIPEGDPAETAEPPLPVDPELIRTIIPGQSDDGAGLGAMTALIPSDSRVHFLLPLPAGTPSDAPELLGFYTYEFRAGHAKGWSTAQGRFGLPLRVTGVQHPAPLLNCVIYRNSSGITASAAFATPVQDGRSVRHFPPVSEMYVMIYAQVYQSDGADFRNVLLGYRPAKFIADRLKSEGVPDALYGNATWSTSEIQLLLAGLTLDSDTPLSCLAVEMLPSSNPIPDPLGRALAMSGYSALRPWFQYLAAVVADRRLGIAVILSVCPIAGFYRSRQLQKWFEDYTSR
jgi:hypothetical protein